MSEEPTLEELVGAGILAALGVGIYILFSNMNPDSPAESGITLARFIYASINVIAPTSKTALYLDIALIPIGGYAVSKVELRFAVFSVFALYFIINFISAWMTAPV